MKTVKRAIHKFLLRTSFTSKQIAKKFVVVPDKKDWSYGIHQWHSKPEHKKLRYHFPLNHQSVVFDFGGYDGQYTSDLYGMYGATTYIFEPLPAYFKKIQDRFRNNPDIIPFPYGLASANRTELMNIAGDATSFLTKTSAVTSEPVSIELRDAAEFFEQYQINNIDMVKINIEGGEYELLEYLIAKGLIGKFDNILVQFHHFVDNPEQRMAAIHENLKKTHHLTFQFPFAWENWKRNN
jgi:FkbM family methyltransferase